MEEMKSARERAFERAERMGKLSLEEMQQQRESKYVPIGEIIAQRFFEHGYVSILAEQLEKCDNEGKSIVTLSALSTLINSINLENKDLTESALEGIIGLRGSKATGDIADNIMAIFGQYVWQRKLLYEENSEEMGKAVKDRLDGMGIAGSAVGEINIGNDEEWANKLKELCSEFESRLNMTKEALAQVVDSA